MSYADLNAGQASLEKSLPSLFFHQSHDLISVSASHGIYVQMQSASKWRMIRASLGMQHDKY
jgi:hypothetical protein